MLLKIILIFLAVFNNAITATNFICKYEQNSYYGYMCALSVFDSVASDEESIIFGEHLKFKSDSDVKKVQGNYKNFGKFPPICKKFNSITQIAMNTAEINLMCVDSLEDCTALTSLLLDRNKISEIIPGMFHKNKLLKYINLSMNEINQLQRGTFNGLDNLECLFLNDNQIETVYYEIFAPLRNLKELRLNSNKLMKLAPSTFAHLNQLEILDISYNKLRRLNANVFGYSNKLRNLKIARNQIEDIDKETFEMLSSLKILFARGNLCIDDEFFNVNNVTSEILPSLDECFNNCNNKLFEFSLHDKYSCRLNGMFLTNVDNENFDEIKFFHYEGKNNQDVDIICATDSVIRIFPVTLLKIFENARHLNLRNVQLSEFSRDSLSHCAEIEFLDLGMNRIQKLEALIFEKCRSMTWISFSRNQISSVTNETFNHLSHLKFLDLSYNELCEIPSGTFSESLRSLKTLYLSGNKLESLRADSLASLHALRVLRINSNRIRTLNFNTFTSLENLNELHLEYNLLETFESGIFENLQKLVYLNIENNRIKALHSNAFGNLMNLRYLDISSNSIHSVDENLFDKIGNLEQLFASNNECVDKDFEITDNLNNAINLYLNLCTINSNNSKS